MGSSKSPNALNRRGFIGASAAASVVGLTATQTARAAKPAAKFVNLRPMYPAPRQVVRATPIPPPSLAALVLNKAGYGPRPGDIEDFNALHGDPDTALSLWLDSQLNPVDAADEDLNDRLQALLDSVDPDDNAAYDTIDKTSQELWTDHARNEDYSASHRPVWQMERLVVLRAAYSKWQLREVLYDFWFNHFNVYGREFPTLGMMPHYDAVLREHIFGNFRDMLKSNARTATMLYYLDNYANTWPDPNENYAREVLELHTLGAIENYYGAVDPETVGNNSKGQRAGYTEIDVFEFAKALTGWGIEDSNYGAADTGDFLFRTDPHYDDWDEAPITVMDVVLTETNGTDDVDAILDYLADHFGTARYIAWKLCTRLIGDNPDPAFVALVAEKFHEKRMETDQLKQVYRFILESDPFKNAWGQKVTRPVESVVRAWRASGVDLTFRIDDRRSNSIWYRIESSSHYPFGCAPPTGYPDENAFWQGSGPLIMSWRVITYILRQNDIVNQAKQTNDGLTEENRTARKIVQFWINRAMGYDLPIDVEDRISQYVTDILKSIDPGFMSNYETEPLQTFTDTLTVTSMDGTARDSTYQQIIRGVVGLVLMSPEALRR